MSELTMETWVCSCGAVMALSKCAVKKVRMECPYCVKTMKQDNEGEYKWESKFESASASQK